MARFFRATGLVLVVVAAGLVMTAGRAPGGRAGRVMPPVPPGLPWPRAAPPGTT